MLWLREIGREIGRKAIDEIIDDGTIDAMVTEALASTWERMAGEKEYAHISATLLGMAKRARSGEAFRDGNSA